MPKPKPKPLTAITVKNKRKPGRYCDGGVGAGGVDGGVGGLYLLVKPNSKSWVFRWRDRITGKSRDKGLGAAAGGWTVSLEDARKEAKKCQRQLRDGLDPIEVKRQSIADAKLERARQLTFGQCCDKYMDAHRAGWRNAKHAAQWQSTLDTYARSLQPLPVASIDTALVIKALEPIWTTKTETATRVRQRIEAVLDWASAREFRTGENPARWRGHLDKLLPKPAKLKHVTPRAALPYAEVAEFMAQLRQQAGLGALALELQILTACRPGEVAGAQWREIDLDAATFTIPGVRMKAGRDHRVPLSPPALALLRKLHPHSTGFVFPGLKKGQPLTTAAMLKALRTVREGFDAHGFRSTFRDWCADCTAYPGDIAESALAHALKDKTEAAYKRTDLFDKRASLMKEWSQFCATPARKSTKTTQIKQHG